MERRRLAKTGMLRSAHMLGNEEEIIFDATDLLEMCIRDRYGAGDKVVK